jgi:hypothetical protein
LAAIARRVRDFFPVTLLGLLVAGGGALALFPYGIERIDLVLLVVGIVALALVALATLFTIATAVVLFFRLRRRPPGEALSIECAFPRRTGFSVGSAWFVPFVRIGWGWLAPEVEVRLHRRGLRIHEEVLAQRRTHREDIVRRFEVGDAFGLTRIAFELREARPIRIAPSVGSLKNIHVLRSMSGGDELSHPAGPPVGERADMRGYVPGDPIRFILWKVFARTREVVVRTPERAIGPTHQTVAYVVTGDADEPAAGAARVAVDMGALGDDWALGADGCDNVAEDPREALELLARSGETREDAGGAGLSDFLGKATPGGLGRALVFVPGRPGPWIERLLGSIGKARGSSVEIVVCTDGVDRTPPEKSFLARLRRAPETAPDPRRGIGPCRTEEVNEVLRRLASSGAPIYVLDRVTGQIWTATGVARAQVAA